MAGIPQNLYIPLRETLVECGSFDNDEQLRAIFAHELLSPWRNQVPEARSVMDRVDVVVSFLIGRRRAETQTNALVLLLLVLRDRTDQHDACYTRLAKLTEALDAALNPMLLPARPHRVEEANPENQRMIFTGDLLRLVKSVQAVGKVSVPKMLQGRATGFISTGTGWLVSPGLVMTCWHVIKGRNLFEENISEADLQAQIISSVLIFDYTLPGQGVEYRVATLESYDSSLDYALLRLEDRPDYPLGKRGVLGLDIHAPLTVQTTLYVIQHPQGQPQQNSTGRFIKYKGNQSNRILHSAPTEPGTSGAPSPCTMERTQMSN